jgi:hypothetical protein
MGSGIAFLAINVRAFAISLSVSSSESPRAVVPDHLSAVC